MAHLATLTPWSTRLATASGFTMCSGVYRRSNRATTHVWRLSPRWRPETCVRTPTRHPNTKAAMIRNQGTKPAAVGISRTRPLTTTWATQVRRYDPGAKRLHTCKSRNQRGICRVFGTQLGHSLAKWLWAHHLYHSLYKFYAFKSALCRTLLNWLSKPFSGVGKPARLQRYLTWQRIVQIVGRWQLDSAANQN